MPSRLVLISSWEGVEPLPYNCSENLIFCEKRDNMKKLLSVFLIISFALFFTSCEKRDQKFTDYSFDCFDTITTITGYEKEKEDFDLVCKEIKSLLNEYHRLYDIYNSYEGVNNLYSVNALYNGEHKEIEVDRKITDLVLYAKDMYDFTHGRVNIAMGSVLKLWHKHRTQGINNPEKATLPPMAELVEASKHTDIDKVIVDEKNLTIYLSDNEMFLDVGAVAKGYAAERVAGHLEKNGITGYIINVGGNVRCIGNQPSGKPWTAGVESPDGKGEIIKKYSLSGGALVTSGSYQRFYEVDGKRYHHIINPKTLMPEDKFLSVSVVCSDAGLSDVLSTALFQMSYDEGCELLKKVPNAKAFWVLPDGKTMEY